MTLNKRLDLTKILIKTKSKKRHGTKFHLPTRTRSKNNAQSTLLNNQVCHLLKWCVVSYGIDPAILKPSFRFVAFINHIGAYKGKRTALRVIKEIRLHVTRFIAGKPLNELSVQEDGIPRSLRGLIKFIKDKKELPFILTLLNSLRWITLPLDPDISSITEEYSGSKVDVEPYIKGFCRSWIKNLRSSDRLNNKLRYQPWKEFHLSTKIGPTGKQALVSCLDDLENIPDSLKDSIAIISGPLLEERMKALVEDITIIRQLMLQEKSGRTDFRRLSCIADSEGKTRVVAIGDYWSQTCLKPLHDLLYRVLRSIPQDQTFDQGQGLDSLEFGCDTTYYSFDLTAFTDRFPLYICQKFLSYNFGEVFAIAWCDIMTGYEFSLSKGNSKRYLKYNVGNPMGFYSSWGLTSLCHHLLIYICCRKLKISFKSAKYKLLGDDIIIFNCDLASEYQKLISSLGMEISSQKTHISNTYFEFAKRIFTPNGEISPFSIKAGLQLSKSYLAFFQLIKDQRDKNWNLVIPSETAVCNYYQSKPRSFRRKSLKSVFRKIIASNILFKRLRGISNDLALVNTILVTLEVSPLSCNQLEIAKAVFNNCIVQTFEESAGRFTGDIQDRLFKAIMYTTSIPNEEQSTKYTNLVYWHPYSFVVGSFVEETYIKIMKKAYDFDTLYSGNWLPYFRVIKASDATRILTSRSSEVVSSSAPLLLKKLKTIIRDWIDNPYL